MTPIVSPSLLASDFANIQKEVEMLNKSEADWIHCDIMDGRFVPNISLGMPVLKSIQKHAKKPLDVHLMILEPEKYVEEFKSLGAEIISVHIEACPHLHRNIQQIKSLGCKAGVAINPHTPVDTLSDIVADIDLVCLMSVNPGFGAQKFIPSTFDKIRRLRDLIADKDSKALIEIDGGVNSENALPLMEAGADVLVAGNFVFSSADPIETIRNLKALSLQEK